ncbi:MAG: HAMP domain-containing sensor histidine kinase, partial [Candidatus Eisenbacteria bacterium]
ADLVAESISLVEPKARQTGVQIVCKLAENTPPMRVSGNEILQVIVNIASNAIDAMPDGGELTIKCYTRGETARIEIRDTGTGMDETTTQRIFEPFFTTKEVGRGTGLGLAVTYRIVREHGGRIMVHSVPGEGSTFTVCLPIDGSAPGESARVGEVAPRNVARPEGGDR